MHMVRPRSGFTLIELSIVMVIIALLIAGIVVGKELIAMARLRAVMSEFDRYNTQIMAFKDKFKYLPGDIPNATTFWGSAGTCWNDADQVPIGGTATCDGDGNGLISWDSTCIAGFGNTVSCGREQYSLWQQMVSAGLITGEFTPARGGHQSLSFRPYWIRGRGGNIPSFRSEPNIGWSIRYMCSLSFSFVNSCMHAFVFGGQSSTAFLNYNDFPIYPALTGAEAASIDGKMDDGRPGTGGVVTLTGAGVGHNPSCVTSTSATTANYDSSGDKVCGLFMKANF